MIRVLLMVALLALCGAPDPARAQRIAKYGAEFLAGGVGARAIGMGGAYTALAADVTAGYWNPAGLSGAAYPEIAYMHVERFAGVVSFDYAAGALPINERSTVGLSFFRSGVNDIVNTLDAWAPGRDQGRGLPKPDYQSHLERFSAADYAFFVSYARRLGGGLALGVSGKIVRRTIGPFADAWGYSFDAGLRYHTPRFVVGLAVQDASTMMQSWSINPAAFNAAVTTINPATGAPFTYEEAFADSAGAPYMMPEGGAELVLPVACLGAGTTLPVGRASLLTLGLDVDVHFDGQRAYVPNLGEVSFQPSLGAEFSYRGVVALRAGINRVLYDESLGLDLTPSVGAGLTLDQLSVDYGFGDFAGAAAALGFSHRISVQLRLEQPALRRPED